MKYSVFVILAALALAANAGIVKHKGIGKRIIGGEPARANQFPFSAAIYVTRQGGTYFCGGALLDDQWILTSAECVHGATLFTIFLGTTHLQIHGPDVKRLATDAFIVHPDYNEDTYENDLGLIRLRMPITFNAGIQPIDYLPKDELPEGSSVVALGWGQTSDQKPGISNELHFVHITSLSTAECKSTFGNQITDNMLCVDGNFNQGTCNGDIGGPLVQFASRGRTILVGVASFISNNGCESTDPSGYTRISPYEDWLKNITST